jgi:hypothetical protein
MHALGEVQSSPPCHRHDVTWVNNNAACCGLQHYYRHNKSKTGGGPSVSPVG